ncbi:hypothetical protein K466DRAFT_238792 [Polyporus arcularius HHB13444]|uniref:CXC domain-containing protein n=1 Tax=Polyporus arcularius HHB13444 TaxID=1314778 RepID=A0A5C3P5A4_9APHY|nr:hypothetical protein K466DRAFT_238792 [Polyporus arcularius HHB13444]
MDAEDVDDELQAARYAERIRERMRVPDMIVAAYRTAWSSFYDWEPGYSEHILRGLQAPAAASPASSIDILLEAPVRDFDSMAVDPDPSLTFMILSADPDVPPQSVEAYDVSLPDVSVMRFAYSKYEFCTPATRNISNARDQRILEFIPYADEPGFYFILYAQQHDSFAWQSSYYDVDYKLIALHAAWSLHDAGLSLGAMDDYKIRFFPYLTRNSGLLTTLSNRDLIDWTDNVPSQQLAALREAARRPKLWGSISSLDSLFCRSTNCVEGLCMLHKASKPPLRHTKHKKTNEEYMESSRPCGPKCYRAEQDPEETDIMEINQDICDILKVFPDAPICKLAILCNADCRDVYYHRIMYLPEKSSLLTGQDALNEKGPQIGVVPHRPDICNHDGPCVAPACVCALRQTMCGRRCGCFARCGLRKGCTCEDGKCLEGICPCMQAGWECSPELCAGTRAHEEKHETCVQAHVPAEGQQTDHRGEASDVRTGRFRKGQDPCGDLPRRVHSGKIPSGTKREDRQGAAQDQPAPRAELHVLAPRQQRHPRRRDGRRPDAVPQRLGGQGRAERPGGAYDGGR